MEALLIIAQIGNSPKVNKSITANYGSFLQWNIPQQQERMNYILHRQKKWMPQKHYVE